MSGTSKIRNSADDLTTGVFLRSLFGAYLIFTNLQRVAYFAWIRVGKHGAIEHLPTALVKGVFFDACAFAFLFLPLFVFLVAMPKRTQTGPLGRAAMLLLTAAPFAIVLFSALAEGFFFAEFQSRFNFIAVDYLVYTLEVVKNIWESYPVGRILLGLSVAFVPMFFLLRLRVARLAAPSLGVPVRIAAMVAIAGFTWTFTQTELTSETRLLAGEDYWSREVSKNSLYALFSAYFENSIAFPDFYSTLPRAEADRLAREWVTGKRGPGLTIEREVPADRPKNWNVVLVVMESMSARFLAHYGNPQGLTPNLDRLADEGLFFSNLYATGTRTVRGLEALTLGIPPTPGESILRRPESGGLFNLGTVFHDHGYATQFIYGGYAYFDDMKKWYSSNGFTVIDRADIPKEDVEFTNAWGVCDEDLFKQVIRSADQVDAAGKPFFQIVMTTSNHRPYTYPAGRIDIPSHSGRDGAVKYADYAVGRFIESARKKKWFSRTLFVFVADHNASVAGGTDVPVRDFRIPAIIFGPGLVPRETNAKLSSQIDLPPTILGLLGFGYRCRFFGQDLGKEPAGRALMGTYQKVALLEPGRMAILSPGKRIDELTLAPDGRILTRASAFSPNASSRSDFVKRAVAVYQSASDFFTTGQAKVLVRLPSTEGGK